MGKAEAAGGAGRVANDGCFAFYSERRFALRDLQLMEVRMFKWLRASAVLLGAFGLAAVAQAAPVELVGTDSSGKTVDSGWSWTTSDPSIVNLVFIKVSGNQFFFEKDAEMKLANTPLIITFSKTSATPDTLVINDEAVTNHTGTDWNAFRMELSSGSSGAAPNFAFTTSNGSSGIGDFKIDPFTAFTFYNNNAGLLLNGGVVKNNTTWFPGSQSNTGLALMANAQTADTFSLKEIAVPTAIPLPAAAWSGLSMLLGLGALGTLKKIKLV